jgi:hypothetical protein
MSALMVGEVGLEPTRLAARDPKSRSSASSDIPPRVCRVAQRTYLTTATSIVSVRTWAALVARSRLVSRFITAFKAS